MKLLTANAGWARIGRKLFWTTDDGRRWADITPALSATENIADVFFLDESHGWVLLGGYYSRRDSRVFRLAHTGDSGQDWNLVSLTVPSQAPGELAGDGWIDFLDPSHGWVVLRASSSSAFSWGLSLATADGW